MAVLIAALASAGLAAAGAPALAASRSGSTLLSVRCTSPSACWAAGYADFGNHTLNLVLRWNGRTWSGVAVPDPDSTGPGASNMLTGSTRSSKNNCWAVGAEHQQPSLVDVNQVLHWNGACWSAR